MKTPLLSFLTLSMLALSACSTNSEAPAAELPAYDPTQRSETVEELITLLQDGDEMEVCDVEWEQNWVQENSGFITEQITGCYEIFNVSLSLISAPNANFAGPKTREWEEEGNTAWAGLAIRKTAGMHENFFKIPDEGYNPVGLTLTEEALVLDAVAGDGAGSGEGTLQRYTFAFTGVADELLYTWQKEKCTGYYVPETYSYDTVACN